MKSLLKIKVQNLLQKKQIYSQLWVIKKYNCGYYDTKQLYNIYKILTNAEWLYKFGGLSMDLLSDYLICQILGV